MLHTDDRGKTNRRIDDDGGKTNRWSCVYATPEIGNAVWRSIRVRVTRRHDDGGGKTNRSIRFLPVSNRGTGGYEATDTEKEDIRALIR